MDLPHQFIETICGVHGNAGQLWLHNFDALLRYCEEAWSLEVMEPFPLSYNFVAPVVFSDGTEAVLKLCVPGPEVQNEIAALRAFNGHGICKLMDADASRGILLLEQLKPGNCLKPVQNDEEAVVIAARVVKKMQSRMTVPDVAASAFPSIAHQKSLDTLRQHLQTGAGTLPGPLVRKVEILLPQLSSSIRSPRLLHGDLHHENILWAHEHGWMAIDPKGVIGELEYEVIPFLMNNFPQHDSLAATKFRVDTFVAELNLQRERVLSWALCYAVLSAWWSIEDRTEGAEQSIEAAFVFEQLLA
ncbi:MAG TPA: aminoglycoside phosphotransferase family protein [Abditibacteriaceae bacterium]|jgi:streptomycin 6-kinase